MANRKTEVDENKVFSSLQIRSHNTEGTLWLVLDGEVYDLSAFDHPGGYQILKEFAGGVKDAQEAFDEQGHSKTAKA